MRIRQKISLTLAIMVASITVACSETGDAAEKAASRPELAGTVLQPPPATPPPVPVAPSRSGESGTFVAGVPTNVPFVGAAAAQACMSARAVRAAAPAKRMGPEPRP